MLNFDKGQGLLPVIIQDKNTLEVLMLGFMNQEAYEQTRTTGRVTFFSRTKNRLWTKGEESGNFLDVKEIYEDCDNDTLLIKVVPQGNTCHTGARSCFGTELGVNFIYKLEQIVENRFTNPIEGSYVNRLKEKGLNKIAQKVGEEGVETVIAALNETEHDFINESSDLLFHLLVLLRAKNISLETIVLNLKNRHQEK